MGREEYGVNTIGSAITAGNILGALVGSGQFLQICRFFNLLIA